MKTTRVILLTLILAGMTGLLTNCSSSSGTTRVYGSIYMGFGYYNPWYWRHYYYRPPYWRPPGYRPPGYRPPKPVHPIAPPPKPGLWGFILISVPSPRPRTPR